MITEEELKSIMDVYGDLRYHIELLEAEQKTVFDKILEKHPEVKIEIEEAEEEFGKKLELAKEKLKSYRKVLDMAVEQFARTAPIKDKLVLRTSLLKISFTNKGGEYDAEALDELVKQGKTDLLQYRTDKGVSTRVELNNRL